MANTRGQNTHRRLLAANSLEKQEPHVSGNKRNMLQEVSHIQCFRENKSIHGILVCICSIPTYLFLFLKYIIISYNIIQETQFSQGIHCETEQSKIIRCSNSLATKAKFKSRQLAGGLRADFFCSFIQEATFYWSIGITSLQSLLKWSNCLLPLN